MRGRLSSFEQPNKRPRAEGEEGLRERLMQAIEEQDQAFLRLVEERRSQVRRVEEQSRDIQAQLVEARRKLSEAESQLASFRARSTLPRGSFKAPNGSCLPGKVKTAPGEEGSSVAILGSSFPRKSKIEPDEDGVSVKSSSWKSNTIAFQAKFSNFDSHLVREQVPDPSTGLQVPCSRLDTSGLHESSRSGPTIPAMHRSDSGISDSSFQKPPVNDTDTAHVKTGSERSSGTKERNNRTADFGSKVSTDLVSVISSNLAPSFINVSHHFYLPSQHKRKLRSLAMNPTLGQTCVTSALDGLLNVWKIEDKGYGISLISSIDVLSPARRNRPENLAWHPSGESLFACYSADGKDNQIAIVSSLPKAKVHFLEERPHERGIINTLVFVPWDEGSVFATGGCDHAVVLWREEESGGSWKSEVLHKSLHSSAVMGIVGLKHKSLMISVGQDRRVIGFDAQYGRTDFRHQLDSKALGMLLNPVDVNLYMVQTGTLGKQLRLFDVRTQRSELHAVGWKQESTESHSALINQSWSPDGLYIASGSVDPKVHIFDIRYNSKEPSQTINAHKKRVLKAAWHHTLPLLVSISSDLNIGLLRIAR